MAKILLSDRERYAIHAVVNPMPHSDRTARRAWDRLWDALKLDEISSKAATVSMSSTPWLAFGNDDRTEYPVTSEQRDMLIDKVCAAPNLNTHFGRMLNRVEGEMLKARDGLKSVPAEEDSAAE